MPQLDTHGIKFVEEIRQCAIVAERDLGVTHAVESRLVLVCALPMRVSASCHDSQFGARGGSATDFTEPLAPRLRTRPSLTAGVRMVHRDELAVARVAGHCGGPAAIRAQLPTRLADLGAEDPNAAEAFAVQFPQKAPPAPARVTQHFSPIGSGVRTVLESRLRRRLRAGSLDRSGWRFLTLAEKRRQAQDSPSGH